MLTKGNALLFVFTLLLFNSLSFQIHSQENVRYGHVSMKEMQMTSYEKDSSAVAVVLFDRGYLTGNSAMFSRHVRIKILKSAGSAFANFQVRTPAKNFIDGVTYNLQEGRIVETKLSRENIFRERIVDDLEIFKVFFPNVKAGSVIDFKYSFYGLPLEWRFQERIPVLYSEINLEPTRLIYFKKTMFGVEPVTNDRNRWYAKDVPAFVDEPFISHYSNYLTHFKFDIAQVGFTEISTSWEKIGERLMEFEGFGGIIRSSPFLHDKASELKKASLTTVQKVQAAVQYIQENMKWNGIHSHLASRGAWNNFKDDHSGNSAEMNLFLIALLKKAGITAYPVIMSTRDNGLITPASASMNSVNYVITQVKHEDLEMLVDATDTDVTPGMLPVRCRNFFGFAIDKNGGGWWVDTSSGKINSRKQFIVIQQDQKGDLMADVTNTYEDYDFLEWLTNFKNFGTEESYVKSLIATSRDFDIEDCKVSVDKSKLKAVEKRKVRLSGSDGVHDLGGELLINPFLLTDIANPFKSETRKYPVDFVYPQSRSIIISLRLPPNCTLRALPETFAMTPETGGASFSYVSNRVNDNVTIKCVFQIQRQVFTEAEYAALRNFFIEVNRKVSEGITIDKKT